MIKVAMIGVGAISGIYLKNLTETFREVSLIGAVSYTHLDVYKRQAPFCGFCYSL